MLSKISEKKKINTVCYHLHVESKKDKPGLCWHSSGYKSTLPKYGAWI